MSTPDQENESLEPTLDVETAPMMEPAAKLGPAAPASAVPSARYWQAQSMAESLHRDFESARQRGDIPAMRERFYILARYYGRTLAILRHALADRKEELLCAALRNLIALHQPLHHMHDIAPTRVPLALTLDREQREQLLEDLLIEVLHQASRPLPLAELTERLNDLHLLADVKPDDLQPHLENLRDGGHLESTGEGYARTSRAYGAINLDRAGLQALVGEGFYRQCERAGLHGLADIAGRRQAFRDFFTRATGFGPASADLFAAAAGELLASPAAEGEHTPWRHRDLIGSLFPRPYQYDAFAIFRGYGYQGQVIEAPTGSGKTLIGMMCIQDWLRSLAPGESILILVPTVNYQQQWFGEICQKATGLGLVPDAVFTGTPLSLETETRGSAASPAILVMTYAALAQTGSGTGKGGFDQNSIETFLQGNKVRYVVLDEVHKVVEDLQNVSADVTRLLTEWLRDGSFRGLIGFSGTAAAYRERFAKLGLELVYTLGAAELIAYGFVAPFAELGVPFAFSEREHRVRELLEEYKKLLREFTGLLGGKCLRGWFAAIPLETRMSIGRDLLGMYAGRSDQDQALRERLKNWESGGKIKLSELPLVNMVQIAGSLSDAALAARAGVAEPFAELAGRLGRLRAELKTQVYLPDLGMLLETEGFGTTLDGAALLRLPQVGLAQAARAAAVREKLAATCVGLYGSLKNFYLRAGEGRVDCIKAIIQAERKIRPVSGIIIFDQGKRLAWEKGPAVPGFSGVAGLFAQLQGDRRFTAMAALSSEIYLPRDAGDPLPQRIADYIRTRIMEEELGEGFWGLVTRATGLEGEAKQRLYQSWQQILGLYLRELKPVRAARPGEFNGWVLKRLRKEIRRLRPGEATEKRLLERLRPKYPHLQKWLETFFDYALLATQFQEARVAQLQQVGGTPRDFFVIKMPPGDRKLLMYELTARIVDAEELPVNTIIVSSWARTGWNVLAPNLLIDATATRNVTAWQQLRGRAMRARASWDGTCYRLVMQLLGSRASRLEAGGDLPADVLATVRELRSGPHPERRLDEPSRQLLLEARRQAREAAEGRRINSGDMRDPLSRRIRQGDLEELSESERVQLVTELMLARNKVTHIYELVKASGGSPQIVLDRQSGSWRRIDAIAAKHSREYSVNPLDGRYGAGEGHAPLLFAGDPGRDLPSALEAHLARELKGRDPLIVRGWLEAMAVERCDPDLSDR